MVGNSASSPLFADRYKFQTVGNDWDTGRSGFTHLVFDIKKERQGVIKRAELKSQQAVENLKNEVSALLDLKGAGVPELYDTGEIEYGSKKYFYMVIEYIDGIRVGKNLGALTIPERADILLQFWELLSTAQQMGIVNGDIDLKHLFWRKEKSQLVVIDWGNAKNVDPTKKTEFAFDLARSAEIIYALTSQKVHAPASGSLALPKDIALMPGLAPVPSEFRTLCKWAPRTPMNGSQPPLTAPELYEAVKKWHRGVPYKPIRQPKWGIRLLFVTILIGVVFLGIAPNSPLRNIIFPITLTATSSITSTPATLTETITQTETVVITEITPTETPVLTETPTLTPTETQTPTSTPTTPVTPTPRVYTDILLNTSDKDFPASNCWVNNSPTEGLSKRPSDENMQFKVDNNRPTSYLVETDFNTCLTAKQITTDQITAIGLNVWIQNLELERTNSNQLEDGRQFGIFLEDVDGNRREYTLWVDKNKKLQLRIRENDKEPFFNDEVRVGNLRAPGNLIIDGDPPNVFAKFPIQIFLEINNQGLDILYLQEGPEKQQRVDAMSLSPFNPIDQASRPTLGTIVKIGLIGYGGYIQSTIWPLVFYGK